MNSHREQRTESNLSLLLTLILVSTSDYGNSEHGGDCPFLGLVGAHITLYQPHAFLMPPETQHHLLTLQREP